MNGNTEWQTVKVADGTDMRLFTARPAKGGGRAPGILVLQEAFGVNSHIRDMVEKIAALGYAACAPELFHRTALGFEGDYENIGAAMPHMQAMTTDGLTADLRAAYDWLAGQASVEAGRIAAVGYCMGGRAAFLANGTLPLACAVSYYGGRIAPDLLHYAATQSGPMLFFWGGKDTHIPLDQRQAVHDALDKAGKPYATVLFSKAEHAFSNDERKSYNESATAQAWGLFTAFLEDNLR